MPSPREQPTPPSRNRRRPETPAPGSWLWLVLLLMLVLILLFTVGIGSSTNLMFSDVVRIAEDGRVLKFQAKRPGEEDKGENKNIKRVVFIGYDRLEGEFTEKADLPENIQKQLRGSRRFSCE